MGASDARGTNGNKPKTQQKSGFDWGFADSSNGDPRISWGEVDPGFLGSLVHETTRRGMACSFSAGRGGDWLCLTILDGPDRPKFTATSVQDMEDTIAGLVDRLRA